MKLLSRKTSDQSLAGDSERNCYRSAAREGQRRLGGPRVPGMVGTELASGNSRQRTGQGEDRGQELGLGKGEVGAGRGRGDTCSIPMEGTTQGLGALTSCSQKSKYNF